MQNLITKALAAECETKSIEFKHSFDPQSVGEWCELIKDLVAMANSGGGIIIFGLNNIGTPTEQPVNKILEIDPADISNKFFRYTGLDNFEVEIIALKKAGNDLAAFVIPAISTPVVFQKPGTYKIDNKRQRTAFGVGTVYFRHGAKSVPGTSGDIKRVIDRNLRQIRNSWIKNVKKVVQAPAGAQILTVPSEQKKVDLTTKIKVVKDPEALPVRLTRDPALSVGTYVHEEVSKGIFDEINNIIEANKVLAKGKNDFLYSLPVYYRIYAEREHVKQSNNCLAILLKNGLTNFHAPSLFWALKLPDNFLEEILVNLYLHPTNRHVNSLMRVATLLGPEFSKWMFEKWHEKWKGYSQPPQFYFNFKKVISKIQNTDVRLLAARINLTSTITVKGEPQVLVKELLDSPDYAATLLSRACMLATNQENNDHRLISRCLDYLVYGSSIQQRAPKIVNNVIETIGNRKPNDVTELEVNND